MSEWLEWPLLFVGLCILYAAFLYLVPEWPEVDGPNPPNPVKRRQRGAVASRATDPAPTSTSDAAPLP
jgi:hypothetical protein